MSSVHVSRFFEHDDGYVVAERIEFRVSVQGGLRCGSLAPLHPGKLDKVEVILPDGSSGSMQQWADGWLAGAEAYLAQEEEISDPCLLADLKLILETKGYVGAPLVINNQVTDLRPVLVPLGVFNLDTDGKPAGEALGTPERLEILKDCEPIKGFKQIAEKQYHAKAAEWDAAQRVAISKVEKDGAAQTASLWKEKAAELRKAGIQKVELFIGEAPSPAP